MQNSCDKTFIVVSSSKENTAFTNFLKEKIDYQINNKLVIFFQRSKEIKLRC